MFSVCLNCFNDNPTAIKPTIIKTANGKAFWANPDC